MPQWTKIPLYVKRLVNQLKLGVKVRGSHYFTEQGEQINRFLNPPGCDTLQLSASMDPDSLVILTSYVDGYS